MAAVLIIDDDPQIRELWADVLSDEGHEIHTADSGVKGIEIADSEKLDVVVTDILMPDKDGIETMLEIKSKNPETKVLVISGGGQAMKAPFLEAAGKLGADSILEKPVDIDIFCSEVAKLAQSDS